MFWPKSASSASLAAGKNFRQSWSSLSGASFVSIGSAFPSLTRTKLLLGMKCFQIFLPFAPHGNLGTELPWQNLRYYYISPWKGWAHQLWGVRPDSPNCPCFSVWKVPAEMATTGWTRVFACVETSPWIRPFTVQSCCCCDAIDIKLIILNKGFENKHRSNFPQQGLKS